MRFRHCELRLRAMPAERHRDAITLDHFSIYHTFTDFIDWQPGVGTVG